MCAWRSCEVKWFCHLSSVDRSSTDADFLGVDIRKRLARNLRRLRQQKNLSQEAFAHDVGIHRTYISDLERGARNPTIVVVDRLAQFLDVTPGALLDE